MSLEASFTVVERGLDVSFEVASGRTLAIVGPNGAGKSTTLDVLAGLLRPDSGRVVVHGDEVTGPGTWAQPYARRTALLAQEPLLFPHLSALENVAFGPRSTGAGRRPAREAATRWLAEVDASDLAERRPRELSGGQAQRVAIARALAADPRLLLLDEPMSALDVDVAPALRQLLRRVLAERTTVLVTHHVLDALLLADDLLVLDGGRVAEHGPVTEVLTRPRSAFAARFAGLNLLTGTATADGLHAEDGTHLRAAAADGTAGAGRPAPGSPAVAVFRPSAVAVHTSTPGGSPRNTVEVRIEELEPIGDLVRVRGGGLSADVTAASVADLGLHPGLTVTFAIKATEVAVHAR